MQYRRLPGTELDLSVVGFGCWAIGGLWWGDDVRDADSAAAIESALDAGINWFEPVEMILYQMDQNDVSKTMLI